MKWILTDIDEHEPIKTGKLVYYKPTDVKGLFKERLFVMEKVKSNTPKGYIRVRPIGSKAEGVLCRKSMIKK